MDRSAVVASAPAESWSHPPEEVLRALAVERERGLSPGEVRWRRHHYGPNRLRETRRRHSWQILRDQVASPVVALLAAASGVAVLFGERLEAAAVAAVLVANTAIGFATERRAVRSMEALRELGRVHARVRRAGAECVLPAAELVPGDIAIFEAGDVLTADARLLVASRLQVDESALTGESLPVNKSAEPDPPGAALPDRHAMVHKGTAVTRGSAEAVVVATGLASELGGISRLVEESEGEATPLEQRLERLGRRLVLLTLAIAAVVAATSLWAGRDLYLSIEIGLALAVAAVPEGLPIVATLALARGMWRMARRHALVERLSAVETLGSTSVLIVDKTGTLTENRMAVAEIALGDGTSFTLEPEAAGAGTFRCDGAAVDPTQRPLLALALRVAALCSNAELARDDSAAVPGLGDPTEVALLLAARAAGFERDALLAETPELHELAFDSEAKRMATLHRTASGDVLAAVKGAPETILPLCTQVATQGEEALPLEDEARERWLERAGAMAARGERVLALATQAPPDASRFRYQALTLIGLVGLLDPPRAGVRRAVEACREAGIRVVMVTGDHGGTGWNIAAATGLVDPAVGDAPAFLDARALPDLGGTLAAPLQRRLVDAAVIARATPRQKLELISLYQRHGEVVAMTGDGINDAPALKKADIGVAMGRRGTQVAREAADIVLLDDELGTIVVAVAQGRAIFENIRKFVIYLLSCNVSEVLAVALASLAQGPLPLLPLQILFLNLVTDVFPALALGVGEGSPGLLRDPPRRIDEPLVTRGQWRRIFGLGTVIALSVLAALGIALASGRTRTEATTVSFLTLALAQLWHVFSMRERRSGWWRNEVTRNPWIWAALALCLALIALAVSWAPLAGVLSLADPGLDGWGLALAMSAVPLVVGQLERARRPRA